MITIYVNNKEFNNDLYSLARSFYPSSNVKVEYLEGTNDSLLIKDKNDKQACHFIFIIYLDPYNINIKTYIDQQEIYNLNEEVDYSNKRYYRNSLKRVLYKSLHKVSGKTLKWGGLTGVRPTKIALDMLEEGKSKEDVRDFMKGQYLCSQEKIDLSLEVANRELKLLRDVDYRNGYSIYIGIPFCPSTCLYCSFASYPIDKFQDMVDLYLDALIKEITYIKTYITDKKLISLYIGGGTPTSLSADQLERLLSHIHESLDFTHLEEYTVEAGRPDSINLEKLQVLKRYNVSRISINPQTMSEKSLELIGRNHTIKQVYEAFELARQVGYDNINMDLIIGLPGEDQSDIASTLKGIDELQPDSITVHALAIKRAARLNLKKDTYKDLKPDDTGKMRILTEEYARSAGYLPYYLYKQKNSADNIENIGYAKAGKEGLYNVLMMEDKHNIIALGAGGLSKFVSYDNKRPKRVENVKSLKDYIERIDEMIERKQKFKEDNI